MDQLQSKHAAQFGQVSGVVGQARNLKMSVSAASATATLTADEVVVETELGGLRYCLASSNKPINLATTGAGGMDTGAAPVNGFVALYAIYNAATGVSALLAKNATSVIQPEVYSGANMPSGYTASALVAVLPTNASGQFPVLILTDRNVRYFKSLYIGVGSGTFIALNISGAVPINAKTVNINGSATGVGGSMNLAICSSSAGQGTPGYSSISGYADAGGGQVVGNFMEMILLTPQTMFIASGGVASNVSFNSYGYTF